MAAKFEKFPPGTTVVSTCEGFFLLREAWDSNEKMFDKHPVKSNDPLFVVSATYDWDNREWVYRVLTHNGIVGWVREFLIGYKP